MIDTHSHIDGTEFHDDLDLVISRAREAGIEKIFVPAICRADLPHLLDVCRAYPDYLYPMIGLHPENVTDEDPHEALRQMEQQLSDSIAHNTSPRFIAVGEVGLDLYWDDTHRDLQLQIFEQQIQWAIRYDLPLMIHCRKAHNELLQLMRPHSSRLTGVFHCFTGSPEQARELLRFPGFSLGIGGVLTFKNSNLPQTLRSAVPLNRIVLETDSPYMAPVPHRGKRNEPAYVIEVAKRLAEIYETDIEEIDRITTENALKIFLKT